MAILFVIVLIDLIGFGIIIPLLPFYAERFGASPDQVGLLMATYSLTQLFAAPLWGRWSDRIGRRPVLLITLAGAAASYVWLGMADALWMLFAARAAGGAMAGNIAAAFAYMADVTDGESRARGMGLVGAAFGLGFILGPAIGGLLAGADPATADYARPAYAGAGLSLMAFLVALVRLPESLPAARREARKRVKRLPFLPLLRRPGMGRPLLISFLATFVFAGMEATFALWTERRFAWGPLQIGLLFAFVGVIAAAIQGGLIGRLAARFGERRLIVQGAAAFAVGMGLVPLAHHPAVLVVAMMVLAYGFSIMSPSLNSLISRRAAAIEQGEAMGVARSATILARVVGPATAGMVFAYAGMDWPYLTGGVVMVGVVFLARGLGDERDASPEGAPPP